MQRRQRRMNPRQRGPRASRNPAYQIKPQVHLAPGEAESGDTETWAVDGDTTTTTPNDAPSEWSRPEPPTDQPDTEPSDPEETSYHAELSDPDDFDDIEDDPEDDEPEAFIEDEPDAEEPDEPFDEPADDLPDDGAGEPEAEEDDEEPVEVEAAGEESDGTVPEDSDDAVEDDEQVAAISGETDAFPLVEGDFDSESDDFAAYVKRIEEAAARSRAERRGPVIPPPRTVARAASHPAASGAAIPRTGANVRRQHPAVASARGGSGGGGGGRKARRGQDDKPFFRRKRTWLYIIGIIVLIPILAVGLWAANVLRLGVGAWEDVHEPIGTREVYTVNEEGTPVVVSEEVAEQTMPDWDKDEVVNIVLMGVDNRNDGDEFTRSDTIIVVHINPKTGEVAMMSIPRDLMVYIPGHGHDKMNAAYAIGDADDPDSPTGGPRLVSQTIEANFNIRVHYYATIDFKGFERIVDTVGGVMVDVPHQLSDNLYPTEDLRLTRIYFSSGLQKMDGKQALEYVRSRHADSDLARGQRQQQVLLAIREKAVIRDLITRAPDLINDVGETLRTDLGFNQMLALANLGRQIDPANIVRVDLWSEGILTEVFPEEEGDPYYLQADWERVLVLQRRYFDTPEVEVTAESAEPTATATAEPDEPTSTPTEPATEANLDTPVMVENGTDVPVLAGHTTQFLFDSGFTQVWASDADEAVTETVIYNSSGNPFTAELIADLLGLNHSVIVDREGNGDIVVVLGEDYAEAISSEGDVPD